MLRQHVTPVDVVVVNYRSGDLARRAIAAVAGAGVRVQVWDNSGELSDVPGVHGTGENLYYAGPSNALYTEGSAPFVLLLNPDVVLAHHDLLRLVAHMQVHPELWGVAPRLLWPDGSDQNYLRRLPTALDLLLEITLPARWLLRRRWRHYRCADLNLRAAQLVEQPPAACLLVRRASVGEFLFDARLSLFFNDVDLCRRLGSGCEYLPDVTALHEGGESIAEGRRSGVPVSRLYEDGLLSYAQLHAGGWWYLRAVVALRRVVRCLVGRR